MHTKRYAFFCFVGILGATYGCFLTWFAYKAGHVTTSRLLLAYTACMWVIAFYYNYKAAHAAKGK